MSEDRDPTIDGTLFVPLTEGELKTLIIQQRREINELKDRLRKISNLLEHVQANLGEYIEDARRLI